MAKKAKSTTKPKQLPGSPLPGSPKKHERTAKPSEEERRERGRRLAATYLVRRDGMDGMVATMIVEGMEPEQIEELITEANTAVINDLPATAVTDAVAGAIVPAAAEDAKVDGEDEEAPAVDFTEFEFLAKSENFAQLVADAATAAKIKNEAEKIYKVAKKKVIAQMQAARAEHVLCMGFKLKLYKGHTITLSEEKLVEQGVDPAVVAKAWKDIPWDDVKIAAVKE